MRNGIIRACHFLSLNLSLLLGQPASSRSRKRECFLRFCTGGLLLCSAKEGLLPGSTQIFSSRARQRTPPLKFDTESLLSCSAQRVSSQARHRGSLGKLSTDGLSSGTTGLPSGTTRGLLLGSAQSMAGETGGGTGRDLPLRAP